MSQRTKQTANHNPGSFLPANPLSSGKAEEFTNGMLAMVISVWVTGILFTMLI